jgi:hypothetical protein
MSEPEAHTPKTRHQVPAKALERAGLLHQISLESFLAANRQELIFRMLNRTVSLCVYERASLWTPGGKKPKNLGVSGLSQAPGESAWTAEMQPLVRHLFTRPEAQIVDPSLFPTELRTRFSNMAQKYPGLTLCWTPLIWQGRCLAGLLFERWQGAAWAPNELVLLRSLAMGYAAAWARLPRPWLQTGSAAGAWTKKLVWLGLILGIVLSFVLTAPLRVVAPCEVAPAEPYVVTAPLNGVIARVLIKNGQTLKAGERVFEYDDRVALQELEVARQQVRIVSARLDSARLKALNSLEQRAGVGLLELRLAQEKVRLEMAQHTVDMLQVSTPRAGVAHINEPEAWRGRPVVCGERVLSVVDPDQTKLLIWLSEDDQVGFKPGQEIRVFLNALPEHTFSAKLAYLSPVVQLSPEGRPSFLCEATWQNQDEQAGLGSHGPGGDAGPAGKPGLLVAA